MRIGIVGAGAIGGWLGVRLAAAGHAVSVVARGGTLAALRAGPWRLRIGGETIAARVNASDDPAALGAQDVVVIALKGPALAGLAPAIAALIGPDTIVVPAMNGVPWWFLLDGGGELGPTALTTIDPGGVIARALPSGAVIGCVVHASAAVAAPREVAHTAGNGLILGEPGGGAMTPRLARVAALFTQAGFAAEPSAAIRREIWYKLWGNMTMNPVSALTGATTDRVLDDPLVTAMMLAVMAEAQAIGARIGCRIDERGEDRIAVTRGLGAFRTSMLQDAGAGKPLEIDQLLAAPREIAGALGMATPYLDALLGLARLFARGRGLYPDAPPSG